MSKSAFEKWFNEQFRERPSESSMADLLANVATCKARTSAAERLLAQVERWEDQRQAALYAWQARKDHSK